MARKLLALMVIGSLLPVLAGQAGAEPTAVHLAKIKITKITFKPQFSVKVSITGFAVPGHWDLSYKLIGGFGGQPFGSKVHITRGWQPRVGTPSTLGRVPTNVRSGERWRLTAQLVNPQHKVFSAKQYPNATFTATKVVKVP